MAKELTLDELVKMGAVASDREIPEQALAQAAVPDEDYDFSAWEMTKNIPGSAWDAAKDVAATVWSPIDTAEGVGKMVLGAISKVPGMDFDALKQYEPNADAVGQYVTDRYGSIDKFQRALEQDPVGVAMEVMPTGAGAVKGAAKLAGKIPAQGSMLPQAIEAANKAGDIMKLDPLSMAGGVKTLAMRPFESKAPGMYESAAKLPTTMPEKDRNRIVQTALEQQIPLSQRGMAKAQKKLRVLGAQIEDLMDVAAERGGVVYFKDVVVPVQKLKRELEASKTPGSKNAISTIDNYMNEWHDDLIETGSTALSVRDLQRIKTDLYKRINFNRSQQKADIPLEETEKALSRGARESIEGIVPEIKDVNRQYGGLEMVADKLPRSVSRIDNRDMIGIGVPIKAGTGAAIGESIGSFMGAPGVGGAAGGFLGSSIGALDAPRVKSALALALARNKNKKAAFTPHSLPYANMAYMLQQGQLDDESNN